MTTRRRIRSVMTEDDQWIRRLGKRLRTWYRGTYVPPENRPGHGKGLVFVTDRYDQPWLAKLLGVFGRFWLAHWKWIIATSIAAGLLITRLRWEP